MLKFSLTVTEYYFYTSVLNVEGIQLMTIIDAKMGQTDKGQNVQLFRLSNEIMIYVYCNRIKSSLK